MNVARPELFLEVHAGLAELERAVEELDGFWNAQGLDPGVQADLDIAIEEIVTNAIRHGQAGSTVSVRVTADPAGVSVEIEDGGREFDPLSHPLPDPAATLGERRGGGLGIFMVTKMMDETSYERRNGRNFFRMRRSRLPRP